MKKFFFTLITSDCAMTAFAMEGNGNSNLASGDTTGVMTLEQIIAQESRSKYVNDYTESLRSVWGKNTFLNLIYNTSHKMSSDEFPTFSGEGVFHNQLEPKWGVGLEWGHTFNFHSKPIGSVLFIGLDYTWLDMKFNMFEKGVAPEDFVYHHDGVYYMPWHNEMMTLGYGMTLGPSLTFYPFTPLHKSGANKVRLQLYYHVGYGIEGALIKDAIVKGNEETKNGFAYGHGLYTSFGFNLSWDFIGIGYEIRNDNKIKYKVTDKAYDTGKMTVKEETNRLYLQFRF